MTSEKRLIDANALLKDFAERQNQDRCEGDLPDCFMNYADALSTEWWCIEEAIANAPTIDAVPVVRCGQCAKAKKFHNPQMGDLILCNEYRVFTDECGFCHKGAKIYGAEEGEGGYT